MQPLLARIGAGLDDFLAFEHPDALHPREPGARRSTVRCRSAASASTRVADELVRS